MRILFKKGARGWIIGEPETVPLSPPEIWLEKWIFFGWLNEKKEN